MKLRPYQKDAADSVFRLRSEGHRAMLAVLPTGTGKTEIMCEIIRRLNHEGKRVMVIQNQIELVGQTADRIHRRIGVMPDIEQADMYAAVSDYGRSPVVVASAQSLVSGSPGPRRVERFEPESFDAVLVDEAHQSITQTYDTIFSHFDSNAGLFVVGFTATAKRQDGRSLAQRYPVVAYDYRIRDAIHDGWLVPINGRIIKLDGLSLSELKVSSTGDYSSNDVGEVMEEERPLYGSVKALINECRDKNTLVFVSRVQHGRLLAAELNKRSPGCASVVTGETDESTRRHTVDSFRNGDTQYLINCAVFTTGFDAPEVEAVAVFRPTKSWSLFTQMVGRGIRPLTGTLDGADTPEERKRAIAESDKPSVTVYSFVGREGSHELVGPEDLLAGSMDPPGVLERAGEILDESDEDLGVEDALEQARDEEAEAERERQAKEDKRAETMAVDIGGVEYQVESTDFFDKNEHVRMVLKSDTQLPTNLSRPFLIAAGYSKSQVSAWSDEKCKTAAKMLQDRERQGLCTLKQANQIRRIRKGISSERLRSMTKREASAIIGSVYGQKRKPKADGVLV